MRALTLTQPWAQLSVIGAKTYETRSWRRFFPSTAELVAIHAAAGFPRWARDLCDEEPFLEHLLPYAPLPTGAIIGLVRMTGCYRTEQLMACGTITEQERAFGDWSDGRWAWTMEDPVILEKPVPCKGHLGLWPIPTDVLIQIESPGVLTCRN